MGSKSETTAVSVNKALTQSVMNVSKTCAAEAVNVVSLRADKVAGSVNIGGSVKQKATSTLSCNQKSDIKAAVRSEMGSAMDSESNAQTPSLFEGSTGLFTGSSNRTRVTNDIVNKVNIEDLMKCFAESKNTFEAHFGEVGGDFSFNAEIDQDASAKVSSCIQSTGLDQSMADKINNQMKAASSTKGLFGTLTDSWGDMIGSVLALAAVAMVAFIIIKVMFSGKSKKTAAAAPIAGGTGKLSGLVGSAMAAASGGGAGKLSSLVGSAKSAAESAAKSAAAAAATAKYFAAFDDDD